MNQIFWTIDQIAQFEIITSPEFRYFIHWEILDRYLIDIVTEWSIIRHIQSFSVNNISIDSPYYSNVIAIATYRDNLIMLHNFITIRYCSDKITPRFETLWYITQHAINSGEISETVMKCELTTDQIKFRIRFFV